VINSLNGAVFGTAWDSNLAPVTISVSDELGIERLKGSKYVQSRISTDTYKDVESKLRAGTFVAFIGTPCQIAGLLSYLGKSRYENLLTIDLVCHGTSPASYLQAEVEDLIGKHKLGHVDNIRFRGNDRNNYCLTLWDRNEGKAKRLYKDYENCYIVGFLGGITLRENCYSCPYARPERISDITIGDFIGLGSTIPFPYSTKNTSCVLLNTERGLHFYEQLLTSSKDLRSYTRQYSERLAYGPSLRYPFQRSQLNARFRELYTTEGWILASRKVILPEALRRKSARLASYSWRVPRKIWKIAKSTAGKVTKSGTQG
jgi:coenzyme F420-reducing hydrogenase beta subunit